MNLSSASEERTAPSHATGERQLRRVRSLENRMRHAAAERDRAARRVDRLRGELATLIDEARRDAETRRARE